MSCKKSLGRSARLKAFSDWPCIPLADFCIAVGPSTVQQYGVSYIEPCPKCGGRDIRYARHKMGIACSCKTCRYVGPNATDNLRGPTAKETMWLRRDEAYRLWNAAISLRVLVTPEGHIN